MTDANISDLCPQLQDIYQVWVGKCHLEGLAVRACVTWRSASEQDKAKAAGLSKAGAGASPHNCCDNKGNPASKAFDFACFNDDASYVKDGSDPRYRQAGELGEALNLEWGGRWTLEKDGCEPDFDHLQLPNWKSVAGA